MASNKPTLQNYPREGNNLRTDSSLFPRLNPPVEEVVLDGAIDLAFQRCKIKKNGQRRVEDIFELDAVSHEMQRR